MKGYPRGFGVALWWTLGSLVLTGLLLLPTTLSLRFEQDIPWRLAADARGLTAISHAVIAMAMLNFAGALWALHIRMGWRRHRHVRSGAVLVASIVALAMSGLGIYYCASDDGQRSACLLHLVASAALCVTVLMHWRLARRAAAKRAGMPFA